MWILLYPILTMVGFMAGAGFVKIQKPTSEVLALVEGEKIRSNATAFCVIGQHGNLAPYFNNDQLGRLADVLKTKDDENALVMIFDGEVRAVKFTTFEHSFANSGCKSQ